jgi:integrase
MKGIRSQGKNSWQIQICMGTGPDGKRQRRFVTVHGTKKDAEKKRNELLVSLSKGVPVPVGRLTVAEHLRDWLEGYAKTRCSPRTIEGYQSIIDQHLVPALGHIQLRDLQPPIIQRYYGQECSRVSARSVHHYHRALSQSLKYAVRQGYLGHNPCEQVDAPKWKGKRMRTLTPGELGHLLDIASQSPFYPVIYTAVSTGMRQAELLGLRWRDVNPDEAMVSVSQVLYKRHGVCQFREPKTAHSRRRMDIMTKLALYLKEYRAQCESYHWQLGKPLTEDDLVFLTPEGNPVDPSVLSHTFQKLVKQAGLECVRFHDLRHTFASLMLMRGVSPKVISEMLGHSSVAFTMDVYSHIIDGMQKDAVALLDEVMPVGVSARNDAGMTSFSENPRSTGR